MSTSRSTKDISILRRFEKGTLTAFPTNYPLLLRAQVVSSQYLCVDFHSYDGIPARARRAEAVT